MTTQAGTVEPDPGGKFSLGKGLGEYIKGTGRFEGIKGSFSFTVKLLPPAKGELGGKGILDGITTYTLLPK